MRSKWNVMIGLCLIALGGFFLLNAVFNWRYDFGDFLAHFWPVVLIVLGIYLFRRSWRERQLPAGAQQYTKIFGDIKIDETNLGPGGLDAELGIGDVHINLSRTNIPDGEHLLRIQLGIGDIKIIVPREMPIAAGAGIGIGSINLLDKTGSGLGRQLSFESEQYHSARRKLKIDAKAGIGDIILTRSET